MSSEEMGTNDGTAEGRREAKFISINVREYDRISTTVISVHWGGRVLTVLLRCDFLRHIK